MPLGHRMKENSEQHDERDGGDDALGGDELLHNLQHDEGGKPERSAHRRLPRVKISAHFLATSEIRRRVTHLINLFSKKADAVCSISR